MECKNCEEKQACVPYFVHEGIMAHYSRANRRILERRLIDGIVFEKLAEEFEMSPRQIRTIVHKNESVLFKHIKVVE